MMRYELEKAKWLAEEKREFHGWDFSSLDGRWADEPLSWSYAEEIRRRLKPTDDLLDMGTGGGEFLLTLSHPFEKTSVTEAWPPNVALLRKRVAPLGVRVYEICEDDPLPMADNLFDVVINRHESYALPEVSRILRPGGFFITQQVGGDNECDLARRVLSAYEAPFAGFSLASELPRFALSGFSVLKSQECYPTLRFYDVGAFVYWAKALPWAFPGFSVAESFEGLCAMHEEILEKGFFAGKQHRFVIVAQNVKQQ